jgi:HEAT repeat protein
VIRLFVVLYVGIHFAAAANLTPSAQVAWATIDKSLHDGSADRRQQTIGALATMGENEEAIKRVEAMLDDKDLFCRQAAALALGTMMAHSAIHRLQQALDDSSPEVRFAAAKSLTELGDRSGEDMLIAVLAGERIPAPGMMTSAIRKAKGKLTDPAGLVLMGAQDATGAMFGPVSLAIPAMKDVIDLKDKGVPGRMAAAAYLVKDPDPYAIALLEWALLDENQFVRLQAAHGLGQRGNRDSIPKLEQAALKDDHTRVRTMAAASIIRILDRNGEPGTVPKAPMVAPALPPKK